MISDKKAATTAAAFPPHIKHPDSVRSMTADVLIALLPAAVWGVYAFGVRALIIMLISLVTAVLTEVVFDLIAKRSVTVGDLSAVVTGVILSFFMPVTVPLYIPAAGALFAIVIVKCAFGGLGCNFLNPALGGFVFVKLCFPASFVIENDPLLTLKEGGIPNIPLYDMIVGNNPGSIGEVSALLLLAGGVYLIIRGTADWRIPVSFIGVVAVIALMLAQNVNNLSFMEYELLSGALFLSAIFAATDPVTTPVKRSGRLIFGLGCGGLTMILRYFGAEPDGTAYAVLTMNLLSGIIDRLTSHERQVTPDE